MKEEGWRVVVPHTPVHLRSPLLCGNIQDVVASDERISVFILQLAIRGVLFRLVEGDVHVAVQARQNTCR